MQSLIFSTTTKKQVLDITDDIQNIVSTADSTSGLVHLFVKHTTAALTVCDLDPGTDLDMLDAFEEMIPKLNYRHPHDPNHVGDHIMSSIIGVEVTVPFQSKELQLGTWQRIVLVELDGPRERSVIVSMLKNCRE